jgi:hypothetical protein
MTSFQDVKKSWPDSEDPCVTYTCVDGEAEPTDKSKSCQCKEVRIYFDAILFHVHMAIIIYLLEKALQDYFFYTFC